MKSLVQFHGEEGGTEIIPSLLVIPTHLKKSAYRGGTSCLIFCPDLALKKNVCFFLEYDSSVGLLTSHEDLMLLS